MVLAIRVHETGGPDQLRWEEMDVGDPGIGEALIRHTAIGLNYIDIYFLHRFDEHFEQCEDLQHGEDDLCFVTLINFYL